MTRMVDSRHRLLSGCEPKVQRWSDANHMCQIESVTSVARGAAF